MGTGWSGIRSRLDRRSAGTATHRSSSSVARVRPAHHLFMMARCARILALELSTVRGANTSSRTHRNTIVDRREPIAEHGNGSFRGFVPSIGPGPQPPANPDGGT